MGLKKQLIVRIVNILLDIVKYEQDMQQEDSQIQNGQSKFQVIFVVVVEAVHVQ